MFDKPRMDRVAGWELALATVLQVAMERADLAAKLASRRFNNANGLRRLCRRLLGYAGVNAALLAEDLDHLPAAGNTHLRLLNPIGL